MEKTIELQTLDEEVLHCRRNASVSESKAASDLDQDRRELARVGKKQVLKRRFGLVSMTGLSCGLMCTWESLIVTKLASGGPAGLLYGFMLVWLGNLSVFTVIGELSSAMRQYHWVSLLAPRSSKKFFSYITGWLTVIGWIAALTAVCFFVADLSLQLVTLNEETFHREGWHGTLILWGCLILCVFINIFVSGALPAIEVVVLIIHILGFFGLLIPLVYLTPMHNSAKDIFTTFHNGGSWNSVPLAFFIGLQGNALCFVGTDSAVHMSEEVKNASRDVARSMLLSLFINGCLALGMLCAILFSAPGLMDLPPTDPPSFVEGFVNAVGSTAGATVMTSIIIALEFCSALGCLAAASRMTWSFARDRGLPFSRLISLVDQRTTIPVIAIILVTVCSAVLGLINLGNYYAFNGIVSMVLEGFYISYLLAIGLLLWRRLRGDLDEEAPSTTTSFILPSAIDTFEHHLCWGPWRLRGALGTANNVFACCYLLLLIVFSFWPATVNISDLTSMNWSVLVVGFVMLFSVGYYMVWARKIYTGPIIEVNLHTL
ncbi:amino acid transporter [Lophiostoma macrostomum CBS 122681]|uniref:Amino acid transporter n=1 Tax=Lophiostoma macrostomum CBS 122681 TaxID=1314788 RepID=A0A6A6T8D7_9PLEO|nr:amino acid transporter [Lophiostoma macrostomum CBS 122681]